jgi:hypothetical protein
MTHPMLSRVPILRKFVDERFLEHRRRSSSLAGIIGGCLAICLWYYRFVIDHIWSWDLFAVALTIVGVKMTMFLWYRFNG